MVKWPRSAANPSALTPYLLVVFTGTPVSNAWRTAGRSPRRAASSKLSGGANCACSAAVKRTADMMVTRMIRTLIVAARIILLAASAHAQQSPFNVMRAAQPPVIDGVLDDITWQQTEPL